MTDGRISVLLPSRARPESLRSSVSSLRRLAANADRLELLVAWDADDPDTALVATQLGARTVQFSDRPGYSCLHVYVNQLAEAASGDWLFLWNDDARMMTHLWDDVVLSFDCNTLLVLSPSSTGMSDQECCFPIFSRSLYHLLGHCSYSPHVDTWLQDVGRAVGILQQINVDIYHDRFDLTGGHGDAVYAEGRAGYRTEDFYSTSTQQLIRSDIDRVRRWFAER